MDVPQERQFVGFDAYKKAIEAVGPGGVVLLTTPPAFRPIHLEHAVAQNRNVFMEKSFASDPGGLRRVLAAGQLADKKGVKIAGGLMSRHYTPLENAVKKKGKKTGSKTSRKSQAGSMDRFASNNDRGSHDGCSQEEDVAVPDPSAQGTVEGRPPDGRPVLAVQLRPRAASRLPHLRHLQRSRRHRSRVGPQWP